ncbi:type I DNA topoisomerase [Patescibacteria group bacterium]|nr:type I DNA topoisomerase [Patescibacteria group bacterium]MBU1931594.1 type I DNA topoisomerase [Patescibacteria group bacterium]
MKLIIVESPTKIKTLKRFLPKEYQIEASSGHVRDLPKKELGVDVEHDFKPKYVVVGVKQKAINKLKSAAKQASLIILATDPDREGEAIAYHVQKLLSAMRPAPRVKFQRIVFHEITKSAIERALANPGKINSKLFKAQQARRILDRLVGYKLSPMLWRKVRRGLSAGRVQSVAVRLIMDKEAEIDAFKPKEYWTINVNLNPESFWAEVIKKNNKKLVIQNKSTADQAVKDLKTAGYQVEAIKSKQLTVSPPPPFITSTLQQTASRLFRWSSKKTMREAQLLYELGLITYHRTDSTNMAQEAITQVRQYIDSTYGSQYLPDKPRFYKRQSKMVQGAHEAIRCTKVTRVEPKKASSAGQKLYRLIWRRFVACQMQNGLDQQTKIEIQAQKDKISYGLILAGRRIEFSGWRKLYPAGQPDVLVPDLKKDQQLQYLDLKSEQKFTQPPARYNEASLIKELEKRGIGRPSTYASIISTIQVRNYVEKIERRFHPTPVGKAVNQFLVSNFPQVIDYDFTAKMEDDLDEVARGKLDWQPMIKEFYQPFAEKLEKVAEAKRVKIEVEKTGKKCPKCKKGELVIRVGRFGKFLSCSRFPDCDYKASYQQIVKGVKCPDCGAKVIIKRTKKGRSFYGCGSYPKCKWASWRRPK